MTPKITFLTEKTLIGQRQEMSLQNNTTAELWRRFLQRCRAQPFPGSRERYSVQIYPPNYFRQFRPEATFEKWAAVETMQPTVVSTDLETLILPSGLYAVFAYRGPASGGPAIFRYILLDWLPASPYALDDRPHVEVLGDDYKNEHPDSEEELWIPIKLRPMAV